MRRLVTAGGQRRSAARQRVTVAMQSAVASPPSLSERDDMTLRVMALLERTTVAEQRRQAIRSYARLARQDENVAEIVRLILASRRERQRGSGNVVSLHPKAVTP